jgi:4-aminobutyrate aminotransferase
MDQHTSNVLTMTDRPRNDAPPDLGRPDVAGLLALRDGVPKVWARYTDLIVERGEGSWIETVDGQRFLDYTSGIAVVNTGHAHPKVSAAIAAQAARVIHAQQNILYHEPGLRLHERLPRYYPGLSPGEAGLFLSNSGAEAIEAAVKLAKAATRRPAVIAFRGAFHGRTHGTMALTSSSIRTRGHYEPLPAGVYMTPYAYPLRNPTGRSPEAAVAHSIASLEELFDTVVYPDDVAAIIVEPILGEGGYVVPPDTFLPAVRDIADRHGILLIADEIQTGFGRTGRFFASEWTGTRPDIIVMAKGIASGLPLSGIMARRQLLEKFAPGTHGGTYSGNAVACAAAVATLDVMEEERLPERAERMGKRLIDGVRTVAERHGCVAEVRGRGLMVGIEFADPEHLAPRPDLAKRVLQEALDRKVLLLSCGTWSQVVRVIPPLVTTEEEIDLSVRVIGEALDAAGA